MKTLKECKLRLLQMHYEAGVGHIGGNLSCMEILYALWSSLDFSSDCIHLSKGHAAGAWYIMMWAIGVVDDTDLKTFHQDGTLLAGHTYCSGSLGHGLGLCAGYALAKKLRNEPGKVYCVMSDGEWDEGSNWEAIRFIHDNALDNLTIIVDCNGLQGFGYVSNSLCIALDQYVPFTCYGHDIEQLKIYIKSCLLILATTVKGYGISFLADKLSSHYEPLTKEQYELAVKEIECANNLSNV